MLSDFSFLHSDLLLNAPIKFSRRVCIYDVEEIDKYPAKYLENSQFKF